MYNNYILSWDYGISRIIAAPLSFNENTKNHIKNSNNILIAVSADKVFTQIKKPQSGKPCGVKFRENMM